MYVHFEPALEIFCLDNTVNVTTTGGGGPDRLRPIIFETGLMAGAMVEAIV
ncbi:MAG: hypothetical protein R2793_03705 [Flavobacteriaceae bacterium]